MRKGLAFRAAIVSVAGNLILAVLTAVFAVSLRSISLLAQAAHTASDVLSSAVVLIGFRIAGAPADEEHPYGHGRAEPVAAVIIAMLLAVVGFEFVREAVTRLLRPAQNVAVGSWPVVGFMAAVALAKEGMARYALSLERRIGSPAVAADAWHHRADALAALMAGLAVAGTRLGIGVLDGVFALGIAGIILNTAYRLGRESSSLLLGRRTDPALLNRIETRALEVRGVREIHRVSVHEYGETRLVSLHVLVDPILDVRASHHIAESVERALNDGLATEATVHVEPDVPAQSLRAETL